MESSVLAGRFRQYKGLADAFLKGTVDSSDRGSWADFVSYLSERHQLVFEFVACNYDICRSYFDK